MTARRARLLKNNSCYHITTQGSKDQKIFADNDDYRFYLELLKKYKYRFRIKIYGFCLMPRCVQLVLECERGEQLSTFMQTVNQCYTFYFNSRYGRYGKLWHGRFKSVALKEKRDVLICLKRIEWIEFLPVEARHTDLPQEYLWSSCHSRIAGDSSGFLDSILTGSVFDLPSTAISGSQVERMDSAVLPALSHGQGLYQAVPEGN